MGCCGQHEEPDPEGPSTCKFRCLETFLLLTTIAGMIMSIYAIFDLASFLIDADAARAQAAKLPSGGVMMPPGSFSQWSPLFDEDSVDDDDSSRWGGSAMQDRVVWLNLRYQVQVNSFQRVMFASLGTDVVDFMVFLGVVIAEWQFATRVHALSLQISTCLIDHVLWLASFALIVAAIYEYDEGALEFVALKSNVQVAEGPYALPPRGNDPDDGDYAGFRVNVTLDLANPWIKFDDADKETPVDPDQIEFDFTHTWCTTDARQFNATVDYYEMANTVTFDPTEEGVDPRVTDHTFEACSFDKMTFNYTSQCIDFVCDQTIELTDGDEVQAFRDLVETEVVQTLVIDGGITFIDFATNVLEHFMMHPLCYHQVSWVT